MASFTFAPLTPTSFLERSASVFRDRTAVIDGERRFTYAELHDRSLALTGALADLGVEPGDRVAALCANSHVMLELHHGVPMRGAVLVPLNIRLSVDELAWILEHSGARVLVATKELAATARKVAERVDVRLVLEGEGYDGLLAAATPAPEPTDEQALLAINYTSGTTGAPKGVMYHHRGAFLQAMAMAYHTQLDADSRYLWTLPMFHCDGWSFPWAVCAAGATHVCLRAVDPTEIWRLLRTEDVTHYSAAPTVLTMIANAADAAPLDERVHVTTGGAPPTPTLLARMAGLGMDVTHLYGLTETFGPIALNEWHSEWDALSGEEQATLRARQGVGNVAAQPLRVIDLNGSDVPADGETVGEIAARGNDVMLGYYRDEEATRAVDAGGWFRTGDLAVMHPDGYVEIRDRSKDIIISGGENIASVEVERAIDTHPDVVESAVVARPDEKWGEVPVAYVVLRDGASADEAAIIAHVRSKIAPFKAPKQVVFADLPKTSTGKIQKNVLRAGLR
ncbi:MAG: acyl--CoA ligase family protein [Nocardioidaceae bacterium]